MSNSLTSNPIVLDTFSSALDLGNSIFGNSNALFFIQHIEWQTPTNQDHTAIITNADGIDIFSETCVTPKQSILKEFGRTFIRGIKIGASGVGSGKIAILLAT
jgi:hypothetical protein